jgi:hypothetical protein
MYGLNSFPDLSGSRGSFLVAASNLLLRFNDTIDPMTLYKYLLDSYGILDDTIDNEWITAYDGTITLGGYGGVGSAVPSRNTILVFSVNQKSFYCVVNAVEDGSIVDSRDGRIRQPAEYEAVYGKPLRWMTYQSVDQPTPALPIKSNIFTENTVDGIYYQSRPQGAQRFYVSNYKGTFKRSFSQATVWRDFTDIQQYAYGEPIVIVGSALHPIPPSGAGFFMTPEDWGEFGRYGKVSHLAGFNPKDLSLTKPPQRLAIPQRAVLAPEPPVRAVLPIDPPNPAVQRITRLQALYEAYSKPLRYQVWRSMTIYDQSKIYPSVAIGPQTEVTTLMIYGTITIGSTVYGRAKPPGDKQFVSWFLVPFDDPATDEPVLGEDEVYSIQKTTTEERYIRSLKPRDRVQEFASTIEKYFDIVLHKLKRRT